MAAWSGFFRSASQKINIFPTLLLKKPIVNNQIRCMSHARVMGIQSSKWQWHKSKDMLHFYVMLGVIPASILTFLVNVFVGPATLEPIPEGYTPKHWEYYDHPITRFIARYIVPTHQQDYEKFLCLLYKEQELTKARKLTKKIEDLIATRNDYRAIYFVPVTAKHVYRARHDIDMQGTFTRLEK